MNSYLVELQQKHELKIMMICLGNICRSPMAAAVLHNRSQAIEVPKFIVSSSGTGNWHVGEGPNPKSQRTWETAGYKYHHTVQQFKSNMFAEQDLLLVMDKSNYQNVISMTHQTSDESKVFYLRQFDPSLQDIDPKLNPDKLEVPDPYYEPIEAFHDVLNMVEASITGLIDTFSKG